MTDRIGLVGTVDTTRHEPFEVSRQLATLDHLSGGRAGWHVVSPGADGAGRSDEFVTVARAFWDSWAAGAVLADIDTGVYADPARIRAVDHRGVHFDVRGLATLPAGPQGHPVLVATGDAEFADVLVTPEASPGRNRLANKVFATCGPLTGAPGEVAARLDRHVQSGACDGFLLTQDGLDDVIDRVVPLLQARGVYRTGYAGQTLRTHLGLSG